MKIYLASGFTVLYLKGKETELCKKFTAKGHAWNRLFSYHHIILMKKIPEIMFIKKIKGDE